MNKITRRKAIATLSLLGLGGLAAPGSLHAAAGPVKIRLGTLVPKGSSSFKHLQAMGEQWRQITKGAVQLTIYPDGTMGGEADMVRRMRVGQLQAGALTAVGLSEIEPAVAGLQNIPMAFRSLDEVDYIGEKMRPMLEKRLADKGFMVLFWADAGWVRFFSKQPAIHPDDMRKTKLFVWAGSADSVDIYKFAGFNPVPLETVDILPNLQTGLITAIPTPPFFALATQIDKPAPNMLELNWGPLVGATVVSKKTWDALPAANREEMLQAAAKIGKLVKENNRRESDEAVEAMKKRGLKVHKVTPEVEAEWLRVAETVYPKVRGTLVPPDIFDEVMRLLKEYRAQKPAAK